VKGITGESFVVESLIPPEGIPPLCDDQGLRTAILDSLPTLDESGIAVRQTGGRDSTLGFRSPVYWPEVPGPSMSALELPPATLSPSGKGKRAVISSSPPVVPGGRRERGGTDCVVLTGLSSRICPLIRASLRSARGPT
jgi:hypothetical protein